MTTKFYLVFAACCMFFLSFTYKRLSDCSKIKNGKFYYYSKKSRDKVDIERFDSLQLETNIKTGLILKSKIFWKNDCRYDMYINALSNAKLDKLDSLIASIPASVEIINVQDSFYVCKTKMKIINKDIESTDTIYFKKITEL